MEKGIAEIFDEEVNDYDINSDKVSVAEEKGGVRFKSVNHSVRAANNKRISDGEVADYANVALEYFGGRCALSGERLVSFDDKVGTSSSNLSAEHIIALCIGGDDIVPNIVPTVLQYNIKKNGYYILDWWKKQKDINDKPIYSPYRLLKLINFVIKSIEARGKELDEYKSIILEPNEIDIFLRKIEMQDLQLADNSEKNLLSDTITSTTVREDGKKVLTSIPVTEGNIPTQNEQASMGLNRDNVNMMEIFLIDAINIIEEEKSFQDIKIGNGQSIREFLESRFYGIKGKIPFEIVVRNQILEVLKEYGITDNQYTIANDWLNNTKIIEEAQGKDEEQVRIDIRNTIEEIRKKYEIMPEIMSDIISVRPSIIYDNSLEKRIEVWKKYHSGDIKEYLIKPDNTINQLIEVLEILKENGIEIRGISQKANIEDMLKDVDEDIKEKIQAELPVTLDWNIGIHINNAKSTKGKGEFEQGLKRSTILTQGEQWRFLNKSLGVPILIRVLEVLKENGIEIRGISQKANIEDMLKDVDEDIKEKIQAELPVTLDWNIGQNISTAKLGIEEEFQESLKGNDVLSSGEKWALTNRSEGIPVLIRVLEILKENGIEIRGISQKANIEDMLKDVDEETKEKIQDELPVTLDWNIGSTISTSKLRNAEEFNQSLKENGVFSQGEQWNLTNTNVGIPILIRVLEVLKENGIEIREISKKVKIKDMLNGIDEEVKEKIQNELPVTLDWNIGQIIIATKSRDGENFKRNLKECEAFSSGEQWSLVNESQGNLVLIRVLEVLKENGIEIRGIPQRSKIKDMLNGIDEETKEKIQNELPVTLDWNIGTNISTAKSSKKRDEFEARLKESGNLSIGEQWAIANKSEGTPILIRVLEVLKENGVDVKGIPKRANISDLIKEVDKETKEKIQSELPVTLDYNIGQIIIAIRLRDGEKLVESLKESDILMITSEEESLIKEIEEKIEIAVNQREQIASKKKELALVKNNQVEETRSDMGR